MDKGYLVNSGSEVLSTNPRKRSRSPIPSNNPKKKHWIDTVNEQSKEIFDKNTRGYEKVHFLGLYWEDECPDFRKEVEELASFFKTEFQFTTKLFGIPTEGCSAKLNAEIATLVAEFSGQKKLLIVYYGGHGLDNKQGLAIWVRGKCHTGNTVNWYETQRLLFDSMGDVVVIIDACYSAEAGRGSANNKKIELLASASMNCKSPAPGPDSYTTKLIQTMKTLLEKKGQFSISTLNRYLEQAPVGLQQTPHYSDLTANDHKSIVLRPLNPNIRSPGLGAEEPRIYLKILFGLSEEPSERLISVLIKWFSQSAPRELKDCLVLDFLERDALSETLDPSQETVSIKTLREERAERSESQLAEMVLQRWRDRIKPKPRADKPAILQLRAQGGNDDQPGMGFFGSVSELSGLVNSSIGVYSDELLLIVDGIKFDSPTDGGGIPEAGVWCNSFDGTGTFEPNWNRQPHTRFSYGNLNDGRRVIIEYRDYPMQQGIEEFEQRFRKDAMILKAPRGDIELCIPHCVGYIKDSDHKRFGLVYDIPRGASSHTTLFNEICDEKQIPIEHRLNLARVISRTAWHLQLIGWHHGSINSKNVLFFDNDYSQPYLFGVSGYGCQRLFTASKDEVDTCPNTGFTHESVCDMRNLGALLHAVGLWKPEQLLATTAQPNLTEISARKLEHCMGMDYRKATEMCLGAGACFSPVTSDLFQKVHQILDRALR